MVGSHICNGPCFEQNKQLVSQDALPHRDFAAWRRDANWKASSELWILQPETPKCLHDKNRVASPTVQQLKGNPPESFSESRPKPPRKSLSGPIDPIAFSCREKSSGTLWDIEHCAFPGTCRNNPPPKKKRHRRTWQNVPKAPQTNPIIKSIQKKEEEMRTLGPRKTPGPHRTRRAPAAHRRAPPSTARRAMLGGTRDSAPRPGRAAAP